MVKTFLIMRAGRGMFGGWDVPHCLFEGTRKQANKYVADLNERARKCTYSIQSLKKVTHGN